MDILETILMRVAEYVASHGVDVSGVATDPNLILALKIAGILIAGTVVKKGFKAYKANFKWTKNPMFWATKQMKDSDNVFARLGFLPMAVIETALVATGITPLLGFATPRSAEEKLSEFEAKRDASKDLKRIQRGFDNLNSRLGRVEDDYVDIADLLFEIEGKVNRVNRADAPTKRIPQVAKPHSGHTLEFELPAAPPWKVKRVI